MFNKRNSQLAAGIEATAGSAETLDATDAVYNVENIQVSNVFSNFVQRPIQGSAGYLAGVPGARGRRVTFDVVAHGLGSAGAPAWAVALLQGCGYAYDNSNFDFEPESDITGQKTLTINVYENGVMKQIKGAMGTCSINVVNGEAARFSFDFLGVVGTDSDTANLSITHPTVIPPRVAGATFTIGSWTPIISSFTMDLGNEVFLEPTVTTTEGYIRAYVANRQITGSFDAEQKLLATKNVFSDYLASTEAALTLSWGTAQYNKLSITAPKLQFSDIQYSERNGLIVTNCNYQANTDSASGRDNEVVIAFPQSA